ncbi:hypothetical protein GCM10010317_029420 [Streptomyces mirabilis]|nr:hypothetical protein GCM10010317_029420 [Streptomyces mirabilis]
MAISRQSVSSSPPENDDFCQRRVSDIGGLSQFLSNTADEVEGSVLREGGTVHAFKAGSVTVQLGAGVDELGPVGGVDLHGVQLRDLTRALYGEVTGRVAAVEGDRLPVECVSWWDAVRFCNALSGREGLAPAYHLPADGEDIEWDASADGYRLPTEAEWEHACRAGTSGPRSGPLDEIAWYRGNSLERVRDVGGKRPNAWGLYDMLGNVWDWCWDLYDPEVYGDYRVLRGGDWFDEHWSCRASARRRSPPTSRSTTWASAWRVPSAARSEPFVRSIAVVPRRARTRHRPGNNGHGHVWAWCSYA